MPRQIDEHMRQRIEALHAQGVSINKIAIVLELSLSTVSKYVAVMEAKR